MTTKTAATTTSRMALLALALSIGTSSPVAGQINAGPAAFDGLLGAWNVTLVDDDEAPIGRATAEWSRIMEDTSLRMDLRILAEDGSVAVREAVYLTHLPVEGGWAVHWVPVTEGGWGYTSSTFSDGTVETDGTGEDSRGEFMERGVLFDVETDRYSRRVERSYDEGETWEVLRRERAERAQGPGGGA